MTDDLVGTQRAYYDERAPDYMDLSKPSDRKVRGWLSEDLGAELIEAFDLTGDVLELACGPGTFTKEIVRYARTLTALDGSARMLDRARATIGDHGVTFVEADIFAWEPDRTYDVVFFGYWLSHVPPDRFDAFWDLVRRALRPGGSVAFVDEDDSASGNDHVRIVDGSPVATRTLADGRTFDIVKVFWRPDDLERRLRRSGWDIVVERVDDGVLVGRGRPR